MQINLAVVSGIMSNEPIHRELASGDLIVQFDLSTCVDHDGRAANVSVPVPVPVAWRNPSAAAVGALVAGEEVVGTGRVQRRFFRSGGLTQTRPNWSRSAASRRGVPKVCVRSWLQLLRT